MKNKKNAKEVYKTIKYIGVILSDEHTLENETSGCPWEKEFVRINLSIRHWNYPILSLLSGTNISSMRVAGYLS